MKCKLPLIISCWVQVEALASGKRDKDTLLVLYAPWCPFCQAMEANFSELANQMAGTSVTVAKYQVG